MPGILPKDEGFSLNMRSRCNLKWLDREESTVTVGKIWTCMPKASLSVQVRVLIAVGAT